jgi:hypothetical protein
MSEATRGIIAVWAGPAFAALIRATFAFHFQVTVSPLYLAVSSCNLRVGIDNGCAMIDSDDDDLGDEQDIKLLADITRRIRSSPIGSSTHNEALAELQWTQTFLQIKTTQFQIRAAKAEERAAVASEQAADGTVKNAICFGPLRPPLYRQLLHWDRRLSRSLGITS